MSAALFVGKSVLVTGAAGGIGRAVAWAFAVEGAQVMLLGRRRLELDAVATELRKTGARAQTIVADVTNEAEIGAAIATLDRLDVAVNAAGCLISGSLDGMEAEAFMRVMSVNITGLWLSMKHEIRSMKARGVGGAIINVGSNVGARLVRPSLGAYAASKAAVSSLSRTAALEVIADRIRVNCLCPGPVDTPMSMRPGEDAAARNARVAATNPSGRVAQPAEIASAAVWLASEAAAFIVGQDIIVDGGASA